MHRLVPLVRALRALIVLAALAAGVLAAPTAGAQPASPATAPPWGACGRSTPEDNVVRQFAAGITLRCGGPIYSSDPRYGYRHILARHRSDFENMALQTGSYQNWRDVADFAIESIALDPDAVASAAAGQTCMSRVVFLNDRQTGRVVREQIVVLYIGAATRSVNTVTPREHQC